jgi:membrane fusion protein, multidrug efflux system
MGAMTEMIDSATALAQGRKWWSTALLLSLFVLVLAGCRTDDEEEERDYPVVETLVVEPVPFDEWISTTGTIEARDDALLTAEGGGTVIRVANEGQAVRRGQIVMQIEPGQAAAAVQQAEAAVAEARAAATQTEEEVRRVEPLARDTIISPLEFEQLRAQRTQAMASLRQAQAAEREAREALEQTRLRAPFDGVVEERWVRTGEQVGAGQEVMRIVGRGILEVYAGIPERFAGDIRRGAGAVIELNAYGLGERTGTVDFVGNAIDPQSRTFPVRIRISDATGDIKADMIVRVRVVRRSLPAALAVPPASVRRDERGEAVLVAEGFDSLRVVRSRRVVVGPRSEDGVVIEGGLESGEEILISGMDQAVDGDSVVVTRRYLGIGDYRRTIDAEMVDTDGQGGRRP